MTPPGYVGYDPERLAMLRVRAERALGALRSVRSDDPGAVGAMGAARLAIEHQETMVLPGVDRVLFTAAMAGWTPSGAAMAALGRPLGRRGRVDDDWIGASNHPIYTAFVNALAAGRRGELIELLAAPDAVEWRLLVEAGSMRVGSRSRRFFDVRARSGSGVVVIDAFIPESHSLGVQGDARDHADPLFADLTFDDSRMLVVLDFEQGRGSVQFDDSCAVGGWPCRSAREIDTNATRWPDWLPDPWHDNPLLDSDIPNQVIVDADEDRVQLTLDILNSLVPIGSVDSSISIEHEPDGDVTARRAGEEYPSIGVYQYRPGERSSVPPRRDVVAQLDSKGIQEVSPFWIDVAVRQTTGVTPVVLVAGAERIASAAADGAEAAANAIEALGEGVEEAIDALWPG